jgi:hypothetical protein
VCQALTVCAMPALKQLEETAPLPVARCSALVLGRDGGSTGQLRAAGCWKPAAGA